MIVTTSPVTFTLVYMYDQGVFEILRYYCLLPDRTEELGRLTELFRCDSKQTIETLLASVYLSPRNATRSRNGNSPSYFHDSGHNVISRNKVLPPGE